MLVLWVGIMKRMRRVWLSLLVEVGGLYVWIGELYGGWCSVTYVNYGQLTNYWYYGGIRSQGNLLFSIFGGILLKAQFVLFNDWVSE
jgi:hypothetical protein